MSRNLLMLSLLVLFAAAPVVSRANEGADDLSFSEELTDENLENIDVESEEFTDAWGSKHLGCVNSSSSCKKWAYQHGYSHSKIQQDFYCPKTIYSCYGW